MTDQQKNPPTKQTPPRTNRRPLADLGDDDQRKQPTRKQDPRRRQPTAPAPSKPF